VVALRTVTKVVLPAVPGGIHGSGKHIPGALDLRPDFGQVTNPQRRAILSDQVYQRDTVEEQITILDVKSILWKIKSLVNQVKIIVRHFLHKFE
jgi:hypothetical protein